MTLWVYNGTALFFTEKQDIETIKTTIGGSECIVTKPLYQEEMDLHIQFSMEASTNTETNAANDAALKNRGNRIFFVEFI